MTMCCAMSANLLCCAVLFHVKPTARLCCTWAAAKLEESAAPGKVAHALGVEVRNAAGKFGRQKGWFLLLSQAYSIFCGKCGMQCGCKLFAVAVG